MNTLLKEPEQIINTAPVQEKPSLTDRPKLVRGNGYNIFFVEDNSFIQKVLQHIFEPKENFEPFSFYSGEECLQNISIMPDIVILDYNLSPNPAALNGLEILEKIKEKSPESKVIMLSSQDQVSIAVDCLKKGATDYVVKDEGMRVNINRAVSNIVKSIELKNEISLLSKKIKRDKLLMKGYFLITVTILITIILFFLS